MNGHAHVMGSVSMPADVTCGAAPGVAVAATSKAAGMGSASVATVSSAAVAAGTSAGLAGATVAAAAAPVVAAAGAAVAWLHFILDCRVPIYVWVFRGLRVWRCHAWFDIFVWLCG